MWFIFAIGGVLAWGLSDMLYKMGTSEDDPHSFLKIGIWVGMVMGAMSFILLPFSESGLPLNKLLTASTGALLSSLFYIVSMLVGYAGLRYLELSIISPIQNASGAISMLGIILFFLATGKITHFGEVMSLMDLVGTICIIAGMIFLAVIEKKLSVEGQEEEASGSDAFYSGENRISRRKYRIGVVALLFPIGYCILDSLGTAINGIALDKEVGEALGEIDNQIIYGLFWLAMGILMWIYLWIKEKRPYVPFRRSEKIRMCSGCTETAGNIFYIYAMAANPVLTAPIIASYCIVSLILSKFILKEKLMRGQYICIAIIVAGIVLMGISEGLSS